MSEGQIVINTGIIFNEKPLTFKMEFGGLVDYERKFDFLCEVSSKRGDSDYFKNSFTMSSKKELYDARTNRIIIPKLLNAENREDFLIGVKNWIKTAVEIYNQWDEYRDRDFEQLPLEIQKKFIIETYKDVADVESGESDEFIQYQLMSRIRSLIYHFEGFSKVGLYLSLPFSYDEVEKTIMYFRNTVVIITGINPDQKLSPTSRLIGGPGGHINQDKFDSLYDKLEKKFDSASHIKNSHFEHVSIPYGDNEFVFMIMPFSKEKFEWLGEENDEDSLRQFITKKAKAKCVTVADDRRSKDILNKIYTHILECKFAIADITTHNPNVIYEVGIAYTLGKDVILICTKEELEKLHKGEGKRDLFREFINGIFDLGHITINYTNDSAELRKELGIAIDQTLITL